MTGRPAAPPAALHVSGLSFAIGGVEIVSGVDLAIADGELLGLIGPNGAGKTTLFNLLSGLLRPTEGRITVAGRAVTAWSVERRARLGVGRTFQTSSVFGALSAVENVRIAAQARLGGSLRVWRRAVGVGAAVRRAAACLERVGLSAQSDRPASLLSHGDKRKLELAILLAGDPSIMLLDEPMAGVSAEDVPGLAALIGDLHRERDTTVVMVEHHVDVVLGLADRVAVMHHGTLLACDQPDAVMADSGVQSAYLGESL